MYKNSAKISSAKSNKLIVRLWKKNLYLTLICIKSVPVGPSFSFLATTFGNQSGRQKYTFLDPRDPTPSCFCNVMHVLKKNIQIFRIKLSHLSVFLIKQYTCLIYVKEKSFCLVNWAFHCVGPRGSILWSKVAKIFHA